MLEVIASRLRLFIAALIVAMLLQWLVFPAAAEVVRLRTAFQAVIDRFDENRAAFAGDESYAGLIMQIDARIVGAMIVIDFATREAAREALAPIGDTLADLSTRFAPAQ